MTNKNSGLAIVMSGGGMRSAFGAGVMCALARELDIKEPEILICGSGSAGTGAYYLSGQYESIKMIWCNLLASKKFLNISRFWKIMDIDYLIDSVFKEIEPLNIKKVRDSNTCFLIATTSRISGEIKFFGNHDNVNIFECLRASKAMPFIYQFKPGISINDGLYCDSPYSSRSITGIKKAVELGAKKIIVINNSSVPLRISKFVCNLVVHNILSSNAREKYFEEESIIKNYRIPRDMKVYTIKAGEKIEMSAFDNRKKKLEKAFETGYEFVANDNELKRWLN